MSRSISWPWCAGLSLLATVAQAQTAPRYVARDLPKPAAALYCASKAALNEAGDVVQACTYSGGSYRSTTQQCLTELFCWRVPITVKVTYDLPAVWPAGRGVQPLGLPSLSSVWQVALTRSGDVWAPGSTITTRGMMLGAATAWRWQRPYTANGQTVNPPEALAGEGYNLQGVTPDGAGWWRSLDGRRDAVAGTDGQVRPIPLVPVSGNDEVIEDQVLAIQDGGMALRARWLRRAQATGDGELVYEVWFLWGGQWTRVPVPLAQTRLDVVTIASNGLVLLSQGSTTATWHPDQPQALQPLSGQGAGVINAAGVAAGSVPIPNDSKGRSKAVVWWQGQPLELQGLTSGLPSRSWALRRVLAINDRGQLLVSAEDTSRSLIKTVLLSPQ